MDQAVKNDQARPLQVTAIYNPFGSAMNLSFRMFFVTALIFTFIFLPAKVSAQKKDTAANTLSTKAAKKKAKSDVKKIKKSTSEISNQKEKRDSKKAKVKKSKNSESPKNVAKAGSQDQVIRTLKKPNKDRAKTFTRNIAKDRSEIPVDSNSSSHVHIQKEVKPKAKAKANDETEDDEYNPKITLRKKAAAKKVNAIPKGVATVLPKKDENPDKSSKPAREVASKSKAKKIEKKSSKDPRKTKSKKNKKSDVSLDENESSPKGLSPSARRVANYFKKEAH